MAETEVSISDIFKAYKQSYANKECVVPWITPLTKTPASRNITIEDWNSAMKNTQNIASDSVAVHTIFCSLESSLENGKFADGLKVVISEDDTRSLTEICKSLSGYMKPSDIKFIQNGNTYTIAIGTLKALTFTIPVVPSFGDGLTVSGNTVSVDFTTVAKKSDIPSIPTPGSGLNLSSSNVLSVDYEDIENNISIPDATTAGDGLVKTGNELSVDFTVVAKKSELPAVPGAGDGLTTDESGNYAVDYPIVSGKLGISNKLEQSDISVAQDSGNSLKYNVIVKGTVVGTITIPADKYVSTVTYDSANKQIVFNFSKGESVKVNVADLIDTYTAGTGLKLEGNQFSIDEEYLSSNKGTQVTVGGSNVATFNADTKVNHINNGSGMYRVYYVSPDNTDGTTNICSTTNIIGNGDVAGYATDRKDNDTAPKRNVYLVSATPVRNYHVANKIYVDEALKNKQDVLTANSPLYIDSNNNICISYDDYSITAYGCNNALSVNWSNMPVEDTLYYGCNGLGISYGHGLTVEYGCNSGLCVDWSNMPVDSSTFYVDSCNGLQINSYNNLLNIGLYDYNNSTHIYLSSNNLDIYSSYDLYMAASSNVLVGACNNITLEATSNSILFLGDKSSYGGCNFPLDSGLWLKDTCGIGMKGNFGGIYIGDKKIGIEVDSSNNTNIILTHNESPTRKIAITDNGVYVNAENSLIEATSSHIRLQYGSGSNTAIEINADGVYIGGAKYGA